MKDDGKKYVVYGMKAKCSEGSMENYISTDVGHGVLYQGQPLLNANDHTPQVNLTHFGDCHSKKIYEEAKKQADEKYKADADDGFFEKAGKLLAKTVTKAAISMKENFCANKCELDTPLPWMFVNKEHMIDGAPALTVESQCACRYGGIITIVPEPEEEVTIETEEVALAENMAEPDEVEVKELEKEEVAWMKAGQIPMTSEAIEKAFLEEFLRKTQGSFYPRTKYMREWAQKRLEEIEEERKKYYIKKYVNEETLGKINIRWAENMSTFKEMYGENVIDKMQELMYEYGITDETSILMFLSTIGVETGYGESVIQDRKDDPTKDMKDGELPYISSNLGVGLLQITAFMNQERFIRDMYKSDKITSEEKHIFEKYFGVITDDVVLDKDKTAAFICKYYPIESAMWYWAVDKDKGRVINDFIVKYKNANIENVFYVSQGLINGTDILARSLDRMAKSEIECVISEKCQEGEEHETGYCFVHEENEIIIHTYGPYGWGERVGDWDNAKKFLQ